VSDLTFISKLIEEAVAKRIIQHINSSRLLQSAYKEQHSVETALIKVHNDILCALDGNNAVALILLDLSAAFDTVDHGILIARLSNRFGFRGKVLDWFKSYLTDRKEQVCIQGVLSKGKMLKCGVPQGSVLGPLLFTAYTSPIGDIIRTHGLSYHLFADDSQLYVVFKKSAVECKKTKEKIESCVKEIRLWMAENYLKLNDEKTEFLLINSEFQQPVDLDNITIGNDIITKSKAARNIGVIFDSGMTFEQHVNFNTSQIFYQIRNLRMIRKYLTDSLTEIFVHGFITPKLDFCNALLSGVKKKLIRK